MTTSLDDEWGWAAREVAFAAHDKASELFEWWLTFATEAAKMGIDKQKFNGWVSDHYGDDNNRFTASVAWDIYKLGETNG